MIVEAFSKEARGMVDGLQKELAPLYGDHPQETKGTDVRLICTTLTGKGLCATARLCAKESASC